jgi:hypothetical protein
MNGKRQLRFDFLAEKGKFKRTRHLLMFEKIERRSWVRGSGNPSEK